MNSNFLNLTPKEHGLTIYRIIPIARLVDLYKTKRSALTRTYKWDDPWENFLLRSPARLHGEKITFGFHNNFFGQCWSYLNESDAMWRIYSNHKARNEGVKLQTTVGKLFDSLFNSSAVVNREISCFIGKVEYSDIPLLHTSIKTSFLLQSSGAGLAKTLLTKRTAFEHEHEIRLLFFDTTSTKTGDLMFYEVEPNKLFEEVVLDPRLDPKQRERSEKRLRRAGCTLPINQSTLYQLPNFEFILDDDS
jgi:hypothetical protein